MTKLKATDIICKYQYITTSKFRTRTVIAIPQREGESYKDYRDRCRLNPHCIGMALTDALPSQFVEVELIPNHDSLYHDTSKD